MIRSRAPHRLLPWMVPLCLLWSACTAASSPTDAGGGGGGGGSRDTGGNVRDTGGSGSDVADEPDDVDGDTGIDDTTEAGCTPGERRCGSDSAAAVCDGSGQFVPSPCAEGEVCRGGNCGVPGAFCEPGEVLGCADGRAQRVCPAAGTGFERRDCPADAPNCLSGECTSQVCVPGARSCQGSSVVVCADDGSSASPVEACEYGCVSGACADPCAGDAKTYVGCDFWALDLDNFGAPGAPDGADAQQYAVTLSNGGASDVTVTVSTPDGAFNQNYTVRAGELLSVPLPQRDVIGTSLTQNSYRIASTGPITAHQFNPQNNVGVFSNDASLLLPSTALGSEYLVLSWPESGAGVTYFNVVAVEEGTTQVTITAPAGGLSGGAGVPAVAGGATSTFSLSQGQVLAFNAASGDVTGTWITADKRVAAFTGNECANVPLNVPYCDHIEEQLTPVDAWDTEYVGVKFSPRGTEDDVWRIIAAQAGTTITTNPPIAGVSGRTLGRGEMIEFRSRADFVVTASGVISLAQFMVGSNYPVSGAGECTRAGDPFPWSPESGCAIPGTCESSSGVGDPALLFAVPTSQFRADYILLIPGDYERDFLSLVVPRGASLTLDGRPFTTAPVGSVTSGGRTWDLFKQEINDGVHKLVSNQPFGLYAYGYDCDVSYAYAGGLNLESR